MRRGNRFVSKVIIRRFKFLVFQFAFLVITWLSPTLALAEKKPSPSPEQTAGPLTLVQAAMCEEIEGYSPKNPAVVFSITIGKVLCFSSFDPVPQETSIYHKWFHTDRLSTIIRLSLKPPRWSTFSSIQLRETDKGPWRVEITDEQGHIFEILRFSITD